MGQAALQYARQGWPVFPCRECDGEPYVNSKGETKTPKAKAPYIGNGCSGATVDEKTIVGWWRRWPNAMIGIAMGRNGLFAVDFDPRVEEDVDPNTGEVTRREFTLDQLKAETEAQIGCEIPSSLVSVTPSGGVHVYLRQPAEGESIRNRGTLPLHVDVRGKGGYVIAPPSVIVEPCADATAGRYRWLRGKYDVEPVEAPAGLIEALRAPKAGKPKNAAGDQPATASHPSGSRPSATWAADDAATTIVRRYALSALEAEAKALASTPLGNRDNQSNASGFVIGQLVGAGAISESVARAALHDAVSAFGDPVARRSAVDRGLAAGIADPRDLADIAARARDRAARPFHPSANPAPRRGTEDGKPSGWKPEPANDDDGGRGADDDEEARHRRCIFKPHTDLGNAERFAERFGDDFRWSPALGWMGWDGRRWVALKQEEKAVPPEVLDAVFKTVRAIQDEAEVIRESGATKPDWFDEWEELPEAERYKLDAFAYAELKMWRQSGGDENALDCIVDVKKGQAVTRADHHRKWGRSSEANGKLTCIARLAQPWLAVKDDAFDADPFTINVLNGTLRFRRRRQGDKWIAEWKLDPHDRADLISKLAPVDFDRKAAWRARCSPGCWSAPRRRLRM
ncbi:bifunctional DNA primase/polymerase [Sphingomonas oryzagri]|uniref:Bifunctional DNA primase/polymerase n=1 Tax=Sphingomonas oryzagri TaxID=3042314 RepID=A0ABT6N604_9SPHN|nr:bifunctional DNA primase/polymerase [Sphingomonas oryzagri]MDH7640536.1 bifunctional DNA primase/polymerase [Sphingomonas oryzagri]